MVVAFFLIIMSFLSIATINVNGLRSDFKRHVFMDYLERSKYSLIFLQETHSDPEDVSRWEQHWKGKMYFSHGTRNSRGVAIITSYKSGLEVNNISTDSEGRFIKGEIKWDNSTLSVASVYAPNDVNARINFFNDLCERIDIDNHIVGGDFNCHLDNEGRDGSKTILKNILNEKDLIDVWHSLHPIDKGYTHHHRGNHKLGRIDYLLASSNILNSIIDANVCPNGLSDHHTLSMKINNPEVAHGQGRWICNNSLINDEDCIFRVQHFWQFWKTRKNFFDSLLSWWEVGKSRLKEILHEYGKEKAWIKKQKLKELHRNYANAITDLRTDNRDVLNDLENQIKQHEIEEYEKAKFRLHNTLKEEGEKPSKYFLSLEKQQAQTYKIDKLLSSNGVYVDKIQDMIVTINDFYTKLYSAEDINDRDTANVIGNVSTKQIPVEIFEELENGFCEEEIKEALFKMNKNKSPGLDGLTVEFYKAFWGTLKSDILELYNECFKLGRLTKSMNMALIRLIYKKSGSKFELKNWRPISLLNVDYKILSKVITNRLNQIMHIIIGPEQTCGIPSRQIHENLMVARDIIDYVNLEDQEGALLCIDQEKAFDRIEWNYLFSVMYKMGIPPTLIRWIRLLYNDPNSCFIVNNFIGAPIHVTRGIRQGCPLSPLLFSICAEGLASTIRNNKQFEGIVSPYGKCNMKLIQHADDTTIFIGNNGDFKIINDLLTMYCKGSGSKMNASKSKGLWLGTWRSRTDKPLNFNWCLKIKILGVFFGTEVTPDDNWGPRIQKTKCILQRWSKRNLSLTGKAVIINTYVGAGITYLGSIISCPESQRQQLNKLIWNFFWSGKTERIKRNTIIGPRCSGGCGILDVDSKLKSLKLSWLSRYAHSNGIWKTFFDYWINKASGEAHCGWYIFSDKCKLQLKCTTPFYIETIRAFHEAGGQLISNLSCLLETEKVPLWDNVIVTKNVNTMPINSTLLKTLGILHIRDITKDCKLMNFKDFATKCNIKNDVAGKMVTRFAKNVKHSLVREKRSGPPNHMVNWLVIQNDENSCLNVTKTKAKTIYVNLITKKFEVPRVQTEWQTIFNLRCSINWARIWKRDIRNSLLDPQDKDFMYKVRHRILATKDFLLKIGKVNDSVCVLCESEVETHEHLFIHCVRTLSVWIYVENLLRKLSGNKHYYLNDTQRILGDNLNYVESVIMAKVLRQIWITRCQITFDEIPNNATINIIPNFKRSLKDFLYSEHKRLRPETFKALYCKNKTLCIIDECNLLSFNY